MEKEKGKFTFTSLFCRIVLIAVTEDNNNDDDSIYYNFVFLFQLYTTHLFDVTHLRNND
jgi:hypothetical protein